MLKGADFDCLIEASPMNLDTGFPGLDCTRYALQNGKHGTFCIYHIIQLSCLVVLANKSPLVIDYENLHKLATDNGCQVNNQLISLYAFIKSDKNVQF